LRFLLALAFAGSALAQYPTRPLHLIVAIAPGGEEVGIKLD
jgi:tripartite-type tricarboxylate transporter receptor subunit TctC